MHVRRATLKHFFVTRACCHYPSNLIVQDKTPCAASRLCYDPVDDGLSQGIYSFKLGELCTAYEKPIKYLNTDVTVKKTRFKGLL